jgi:branched-chain amino acid transport system ATP-binding protein
VTLLAVRDLDVRHGLLPAVRGVSFEVAEGETVAFVGANGAGKTTLLRAIAGAHRPASGTVSLEGSDVTRVPAYKRVGLGIALVPEGRKLFPQLTVEENLLVARRKGGRWDVDRVLEAFPLLQPLRHRRAGTLSGGEQQATAIGRALMANPRLLLLDEVSLGLAPVAVDAVYRSLSSLIEARTTMLIVEQDLARALSSSDRVICMLEGRIVLTGASRELTREQITDAYFGLKAAAQ